MNEALEKKSNQCESRPPALSEATLIRMSRYINVLEEFVEKEIPHISTRKLADLLGVNPAVVKQDFLPLNVKGQTGVGYEVPVLMQAIRDVFLSRGTLNFAIVGFGNIGQALSNYIAFEKQGFLMKAIFDVNPRFHQYQVRGVPVDDVESIEAVCKERKIDIGLICTPASCAQDLADKLVTAGVKGIWNFAPTELVVPDEVILVHEHLTRGLLALSYHIGLRYGLIEEPPTETNEP